MSEEKEMTEQSAKARNAGRLGVSAAKEPAVDQEAVEAAKAGPEAEWPRTIRTTMEPHREYQVEESEYLDLMAQGLIKEEGE